jgi:hypothetical protein
MKLIGYFLNKLGYYNLKSSNKYRYVKELYDETRTMNRITPLVKEVLDRNQVNSKKFDFQEVSSVGTESKPKIFQYWHQGFDNLPVIIKNCYASIDYYLGQDFEVIRIDKESLSNFIVLPAHIIQLQENGNMSIAHFSDIIRNKLLFEFGGLWLDSTVLITGKDDILRFISLDNRLMFSRFVFSNPKEHAVQFESWIIWSRNKGNLVYKIAEEVLSEYWRKHKDVGNYFLYHIVLTTIFLNEERFKDLFNWNNRIYLGNSLDLGHYMIGENFNSNLLKSIKDKTDIHKLDFKHTSFGNGTFGDYFSKELFSDYILI